MEEKVGIFFIDGNDIVYSISIDTSKAEDVNRPTLSIVNTHEEIWSKVQKLHPEYKKLKYTQLPRGRIMYIKETGKYKVHVGDWISGIIKLRILSKFNLPLDTEFKNHSDYNLNFDESVNL